MSAKRLRKAMEREYEFGRCAAFEGRPRVHLSGLYEDAEFERWAWLAGYDDGERDLRRLAQRLDALSTPATPDPEGAQQ